MHFFREYNILPVVDILTQCRFVNLRSDILLYFIVC